MLYSQSVFNLQQLRTMRSLLPHLPDAKVCGAIVFIDPDDPFWIQVNCNESNAASYLICKIRYNSSVPDPSDIQTQYVCNNGLFLINQTCCKLIHPEHHISMDISLCREHNMTTVSTLEDELRTSGGLLNNVLTSFAFYGLRSVQINTTCLILVTQSIQCTPDQWTVKIDTNCMAQIEYTLCVEPAWKVVSCSRGQFECSDGSCILQSQVCDGLRQCLDGQDEQYCWCTNHDIIIEDFNFCYFNCSRPTCVCPPMYYQCAKGGCIQYTYVCDRIKHCIDGSDEFCDHYNLNVIQNNTYLSFLCLSGLGIPYVLFNDLIPDCPGNESEDEMQYIALKRSGSSTNVCPFGTFPCVIGLSRCFNIYLICQYDLDMLGNIMYCRNAAHLKHCENITCTNSFKCPNSYCIPYRRVCDGMSDCSYGEDEQECESQICNGMLRCKTSPNSNTVCVHISEICDGINHCINGEDEILCDVGPCPPLCTCLGLAVNCDYSNITASLPIGIHYTTIHLSISHNTISIGSVFKQHSLQLLLYMDLSHNNILDVCILSWQQFQYLHILKLHNNDVSIITLHCFDGLVNLQILHLQLNKLQSLSENINIPSMRFLNISNNKLDFISSGFFVANKKLSQIFIQRNPLSDLGMEVIYGLKNISMVETDDVRFCCLLTELEVCANFDASVSSCSDLIASPISRVFLCIMFTVCIILNCIAFSFHSRRKLREKESSQSLLIKSLCVSDSLAGLYLAIIAVADVYYRDEFSLYYISWQVSMTCKIASIISAVSYISSAVFLDVISILRCLTITTFSAYSFQDINVTYIIWCVFIIVFLLSSSPFLVIFFLNESSSIPGSLCLSVSPLGRSVQVWTYFSLAFNIIIVLSFIIIIICYVAIYFVIIKTRKEVKKTSDSKLKSTQNAVPVFIILITASNLFCWSPLCVISFVTVAGYQLPLAITNAIIGIAMPLNSILNPCLYTIGTKNFRLFISKWCEGNCNW